MTIEEIENRFKQISNINEDLSQNLIKKNKNKKQRVSTNKEKSREFGEVFTPLHLVDIMIYLKFNNINQYTHTYDLCSSFGIFTIRLMRILYNKYHMNVEEWLKDYHTFTEIQAESCAKLIWIFGPNINVYVGDSNYIDKVTDDEDERGILFYDSKNKWHKIDIVTELVHTYKDNLEALTFIFKNATKNDELQKLKDNKITFDEEKEEKQVEVNEQIKVKEIIETTVKDESKSVQEVKEEKTPSSKPKKQAKPKTIKLTCKGRKKSKGDMTLVFSKNTQEEIEQMLPKTSLKTV